MAIFLSSFLNKVDKKGRVSVPASFRGVLAKDSPEGVASSVIVFRSLQFSALEACSPEHMDRLAETLDQMDIPPEEKDLFQATIFAGSIQLGIDAEGRILIPQDMLDFAGITEQASFVANNKTFQIWEPAAHAARMEEARKLSRAAGLSLSSISLAGRRPAAAPAKE
ncbi:MraZ family transcriptional regulator [Skermanella mucosa]|uniref:division/cell wall cluster transcriptional repressor MraZ n=1 Tax=Skermanella TaxID=204447 RepID=UPI00192B3D20|nr:MULTISPECIES: MraZ family transcriptional regulator [Skermanella]UEM02163.1 MraZ family transcriptional regulator [Skermanella rosea]UEM19493.1 MraZ family transcriptional regulator [Skermanella mucosa]